MAEDRKLHIRSILFVLFCLAIVAILARVAAYEAAADDAATQPGGQVQFQSLNLHDDQRNKDIPLRAAWPRETDGPLPLIVFSHGATGSREGYTPLVEYWVSQGYICLQPSHADAWAMVKARRQDPQITPREVLRKVISDPQAWLDRARDVSFVIDSLDVIQERIPALAGRIDPAHIGVGGHSFGAHTAAVIGGATVTLPGSDQPTGAADPRVKAVLLLSAQGPGQMGLTQGSWDQLRLPMMTMTGSRDAGFGAQNPRWRTAPFERSPAGNKYCLFIDGATHMTFSGRRSALLVGGGWDQNQDTLFAFVQKASTAFWDVYLKGHPKAKELLVSDFLSHSGAGPVEVQRK